MNRSDPVEPGEISMLDERFQRVGEAIEAAGNPGREGPYGLYDYSAWNHPRPHHVRDFRDPASATHGDCVFQSADRDEAVAAFERLTRDHVARAAVAAMIRSFGLSEMSYESMAPTDEQRTLARASGLYAKGDMQLVWVNVHELFMASQMFPSP